MKKNNKKKLKNSLSLWFLAAALPLMAASLLHAPAAPLPARTNAAQAEGSSAADNVSPAAFAPAVSADNPPAAEHAADASFACADGAAATDGAVNRETSYADAAPAASCAEETAGTGSAAALAQPTAFDNSEELAARPGMMGRLYIPDIGVSVAVFDTDRTDVSVKQAAVDAADSAAWWREAATCFIADHDYETNGSDGFILTESAVPGQTVSYLQSGSDVSAYTCVDAGVGRNTGTQLLDRDGRSLGSRSGADFMTYTCYDGWEIIYYTVWAQRP